MCVDTWIDMPRKCRNRSDETSEREMKCYENGCGFRGAYRYVKIHWDGTHSNGKQVFVMKCGQNECEWFCYKTMKFFVYHMNNWEQGGKKIRKI